METTAPHETGYFFLKKILILKLCFAYELEPTFTNHNPELFPAMTIENHYESFHIKQKIDRTVLACWKALA